MTDVRVRFAPSPTGALHIGGVRTALYNYLFAKKHQGTFILRIEDTDQTRYVVGAEQYIAEALHWIGFEPEESPQKGGNYGPYRQSERKDIYKQYADQLIELGHAYYAFDTPDELDTLRKQDPEFKYGVKTRNSLKNSLSLSPDEVQRLLAQGEHITVRLKIPADEIIEFTDHIRGHVSFDSNELDDKVILKGDGMPTYHLANIVDDHLMKISHVIRGEEWLSSTPHHVIMYRSFGWQAPEFAHLPLILKPTGQGKLSKRDGAKFGFPVFPLSWIAENEEDSFIGFREDGYLPEALGNFLALLGWSPGDDEEILDIEAMIPRFSLDKIVKSGARFDIDKALWFNQQYIIKADNHRLASLISKQVEILGYQADAAYLSEVCRLMKERVHRTHEIVSKGMFFFSAPTTYDDATIIKKYKAENKQHLLNIADQLMTADQASIESAVKGYVQDNQLKLGEFMPIIRIAISGNMQGPDLIESMALLGGKESAQRIKTAVDHFEKVIHA